MKSVQFEKLNGSALKIGIVASRWNEAVIDPMLADCRRALADSGVKEKNIFVTRVPGSFELVYAAERMIQKNTMDAVVAIGCLIKGETAHFEYIAEAVAQGLMRLNLEGDVPVIFGVLTCLNEKQARERATGKKAAGYAWGLTAVEMGLLNKY